MIERPNATGAGIVTRAVMGSRVSGALLIAACGVSSVLLASGCGEAQRDASERTATYTVEVTTASFPSRQAISRDTSLRLAVRNASARAIPNVAITLDSLSYASPYPRLADRQRPVWIVNTGPGPVANPPVETAAVNPPEGAGTAFVHTWALGRVAPGTTKTFTWHVTPVKAGVHTVHYAVAAGLDGKAKVRLANGETATGTLRVSVAPAPPPTHVNPETGHIAAGPPPVAAGPVGAAP